MKVRYEFATETVTVEVSDEWGKVVLSMNEDEKKNDRKETRRHESLDLSMDESPWVKSDEDDPDTYVAEKLEEGVRIRRAMDHLTDKQKDVICQVYYRGYNLSEYAAMRGISKQAASKALKYAENNLKKFL